jgi:hypothetical protein
MDSPQLRHTPTTEHHNRNPIPFNLGVPVPQPLISAPPVHAAFDDPFVTVNVNGVERLLSQGIAQQLAQIPAVPAIRRNPHFLQPDMVCTYFVINCLFLKCIIYIFRLLMCLLLQLHIKMCQEEAITIRFDYF